MMAVEELLQRKDDCVPHEQELVLGSSRLLSYGDSIDALTYLHRCQLSQKMNLFVQISSDVGLAGRDSELHGCHARAPDF